MSMRATLDNMVVSIMDMAGTTDMSQSRFNYGLIAMLVIEERNRLARQEARKGAMDDDWFTERTIPVTMERGLRGLTLPYGHMSMVDDTDIRLYWRGGTGNEFVRFPAGLLETCGELAFAEGRIPWAVRNGRVVFPTITEGIAFPPEIDIQVVEDAPSDNTEDRKREIPMPPEFRAMVRDLVMRRLGMSNPADRTEDSKPTNSQ